MSNSNTSTIKPGAISGRTEEPRGGIANAFIAQLTILVLAGVLWWIAREMVVTTSNYQNIAEVRIELAEEIRGQWRIRVPAGNPPVMPIGLEISGPTREINVFASDLERNPGRFGYRYEITEADIQNLPEDARYQIEVGVNLARLRVAGSGSVPTELSVKPLASERAFRVVLERYIPRRALVDVAGGIVGEVEGYDFAVSVVPDFQVEVYGPASEVIAVSDADANAIVPIVTTDVNEILANLARLSSTTVEEILQRPTVAGNLALVPSSSELVVRRRGQLSPISEVPVQFRFTAKTDYQTARDNFPVGISLPAWLLRKGARVVNPPDPYPVVLDVLSSQVAEFNQNNVKVVIDMLSLEENSMTPETIEGPPRRKRIVVSGLWYSIRLPGQRLTIRPFDSPDVSLARYVQAPSIEIEWTESE